jgi:phosphate:Na+ symporter
VQIATISVACFQTRDKDLASKVIYMKRNVRKMEQRMREAHIARMVKGNLEAINTSSIHLDLLGEYRRIVGLLSNHVYPLMKDNDPYNILPRRV